MTTGDIMRVAANMGYATSFVLRATPSAQARADYAVYVCLWLHGKQRSIGNLTKLAQLSEVELRKRIENKVKTVEGNVERSRH